MIFNIKMQLFIKMPSPYNRSFVFSLDLDSTFTDLKNMINNKTVYGDLKYYLIFGAVGIINEQNEHLTIRNFNGLNPNKKISDEMTLTLCMRNFQWRS